MPNVLPGFIRDGYTEQGYIAEIPRLHQSLTFDYRPFTNEQRQQLIQENGKLGEANAARNSAKVLATKIKSWDLHDEKGNVAPISPLAILHLRPALYDRLFVIVLGLAPSDEPVGSDQSDAATSLADLLAAQEGSVLPGEAAQDRHAGN